MEPPTKVTGKSKSLSSSTSSNSKIAANAEEKIKDKVKGEKRKKDETANKNAKTSDNKYSSDFLRQKLRDYFHHTDFKSTLQKDAIKEIMRGTTRRSKLFSGSLELKFKMKTL